MMTKKRKHIIIAVLAACCLAIAIWSVVRYQARRELLEQFNSDLALRFDDIIDTTYPLIDNYATAINTSADSIVVLAKRAKADHSRSYLDAFSIAWEQYIRTSNARKGSVMTDEYEYFKKSPVFTMLTNSGDKRLDEAEALKKLSLAGMMLREPYFLEYDSVMSTTQTAKRYIADCIKVMEPYRSSKTDITAWRAIKPENYFKMFEKYNKKKN